MLAEEEHTASIRIVPINLVDMAVMNDFAPPLSGWRLYRIEYDFPNERTIWEGRILLPPRADPDMVAQILMGMQAHGQLWRPI